MQAARCASVAVLLALALLCNGGRASVIGGGLGATRVNRSFAIANDQFLRDGRPMQLRAGCIHYSRVPVEYWEDRLLRLRAMGLNAVQTYVPWNWHQPEETGPVNWSGDRNLTGFLAIAQRLEMVVVLRAGPYMCGEWEFGGLPAWLLKDGPIALRTMAHPYWDHVEAWWGQHLLPQVKPWLYANGGPVVMVQVENEYGSYGDVSKNPDDLAYMKALIALARQALGPAVVLFTTDGGSTSYMSRGSIKGSAVYTVGDGCGNPRACKDAQAAFNDPGQSPFMCSECYTGWLTHWGEGGANTSSSAPHVDSILTMNGSVSLYMGHGGTNFGFWSGANGGGGSSYSPHETSYDYDSPVSEAGEHGFHSGVDKYVAMQAVLAKHSSGTGPAEPPLAPRRSFGTIALAEAAPLLSNVAVLAPQPAASGSPVPPFAEAVGCWYGFLLYTTTLQASAAAAPLVVGGVRDRVQVFVDGEYQGVSYRTGPVVIAVTAKAGARLQLLVENMGRINFSHGMDDEVKGITGNVTLGGAGIPGAKWDTYCLPLKADELTRLRFGPVSAGAGVPAFYRGTWNVDTPADTFVDMRGWTKGIVWVNGFNLGRYWDSKGPQHTLYLPAPRLVAGANTLLVLELHAATANATVALAGEPILRNPPPTPDACSPAATAVAGSVVAMFSWLPKLAHQQEWDLTPDGRFALRSDPSLCVSVLPGCPHASRGCLVMGACANATAFTLKPDPSKGAEGGAHLVVGNVTGRCLDIYSHDAFEGAPLDMYACYGSGEDNQRWKYDSSTGSLLSFQAGPTAEDYAVTACTSRSIGAGVQM